MVGPGKGGGRSVEPAQTWDPERLGTHQLQHEPHASGSIICNVEFETTAQN